jgi:hypothetical protein
MDTAHLLTVAILIYFLKLAHFLDGEQWDLADRFRFIIGRATGFVFAKLLQLLLNQAVKVIIHVFIYSNLL